VFQSLSLPLLSLVSQKVMWSHAVARALETGKSISELLSVPRVTPDDGTLASIYAARASALEKLQGGASGSSSLGNVGGGSSSLPVASMASGGPGGGVNILSVGSYIGFKPDRGKKKSKTRMRHKKKNNKSGGRKNGGKEGGGEGGEGADEDYEEESESESEEESEEEENLAFDREGNVRTALADALWRESLHPVPRDLGGGRGSGIEDGEAFDGGRWARHRGAATDSAVARLKSNAKKASASAAASAAGRGATRMSGKNVPGGVGNEDEDDANNGRRGSLRNTRSNSKAQGFKLEGLPPGQAAAMVWDGILSFASEHGSQRSLELFRDFDEDR
jgi:hypothetical protein